MRITSATYPLANVLRHAGPLRRLRGWNRLLYTLFHPDAQGDFRFTLPFGTGLRYPGRADEFVDWSVFFFGAYEHDLLDLLASEARNVARGCVFVDVGANVGHHALFMAPHCATVHAFEPNPQLWKRIQQKAELNRVRNITLHKAALGEVDAQLPFFPPLSVNSGTGSLIGGTTANAAAPILVPVRRGDSIFMEIGIDQVDIVKLDIQGYEPRALQGLGTTLHRHRPLIVFEVSDENKATFSSVDAIKSFLPIDYELSYLRLGGWMLNSHREVPLSDDVLAKFYGDVICRPKTRSGAQAG